MKFKKIIAVFLLAGLILTSATDAHAMGSSWKRWTFISAIATAVISGAYYFMRPQTTPEAGAYINLQNQHGNTELMIAASIGLTEAVHILITAGADLNLQNEDGDTALLIAIGNNHTDIVHALITAGAHLGLENKSGYFALTLAIENNNTAIIEALTEANNVYFTQLVQRRIAARENLNCSMNKHGLTALMIAASRGLTETVRNLITAGADLNLQNIHVCGGYTALMIAADKGHIDTVLALIEAGADLNLKNNDGDDALIIAIRAGHIDIARALMNVNPQNSHACGDYAASMIPAYKGRINIAQALIKAGCIIIE